MSHVLSKMWFIFSSPTSEVRETPETCILPIHTCKVYQPQKRQTKKTNKKQQNNKQKSNNSEALGWFQETMRWHYKLLG